MQRLITGIVGIVFGLVALFTFPPPAFLLVAVGVCTLCAFELVAMLKSMVWRPALSALVFLVPLLALLLIGLSEGRVDLSPLIATILVLFIPLAAGLTVLLTRAPLERALPTLGMLSFAAPYLALPAAAIYRLQTADPWLCLALFGIVWLADTMAYYGGKTFGRTKLAPVISPKKTWEGSASGFVGSLLAVGAYVFWRRGGLDTVDLRFALVVGVTAVLVQLGDLVESMIKRSVGVKDSGRLLPGHGGLLDRFDGLLLASPVFWLGFELGWL